MKHLKVYEEYSNICYKEITYHEYLYANNIIAFSQREIKIIDDLIDKNRNLSITYDKHPYTTGNIGIKKLLLKVNGEIFIYEVDIVKDNDEWFIVALREINKTKRTGSAYDYNMRYIKCDQIEGVVEFLNDLILLKQSKGPLSLY
jgi:hypothetical protein